MLTPKRNPEKWYAWIKLGLNYDPEQEGLLVSGTQKFVGCNAPGVKRFFPALKQQNLATLIGRLHLREDKVNPSSYLGRKILTPKEGSQGLRVNGQMLASSEIGEHYLILEDVQRGGLLRVTYEQSGRDWSASVTFEGVANQFVAAAREYVEQELRSPLDISETRRRQLENWMGPKSAKAYLDRVARATADTVVDTDYTSPTPLNTDSF